MICLPDVSFIYLQASNVNGGTHRDSLIITVQKITGQSSPDWVKMTSPQTSKSNNGELSRF